MTTIEDLKQTKQGSKFFNRVNQTPTCWLWTVGTMSGYGWMRCPKRGRNFRTHQWIMMELFGEVPSGKEVCHKCNIRLCVNPEHLYFGTRSENQKDSVRARTHNWVTQDKHGEKHPTAVLTDEVVKTIRSLRDQGIAALAIARHLKINPSTVNNVFYKRGRWSHIP